MEVARSNKEHITAYQASTEDRIRIFSDGEAAALKFSLNANAPSTFSEPILRNWSKDLRKLVLEAIRLCWTGQFSRMVSEDSFLNTY